MSMSKRICTGLLLSAVGIVCDYAMPKSWTQPSLLSTPTDGAATDSGSSESSDSNDAGNSSGSGNVFGSISNLITNTTVVLDLNNVEKISQNTDGAFSFKTHLNAGDAYNVTIATQPEGQQCSVLHGTGTFTGSLQLMVVCAPSITFGTEKQLQGQDGE